jgi:hypothetical protein
MANYRLPGFPFRCRFAPKYPPRLFLVTRLRRKPQPRDSGDVERRIETTAGKISGGSPRDDEFTNVVVHPSSDQRMCVSRYRDCAADAHQRPGRGLGGRLVCPRSPFTLFRCMESTWFREQPSPGYRGATPIPSISILLQCGLSYTPRPAHWRGETAALTPCGAARYAVALALRPGASGGT